MSTMIPNDVEHTINSWSESPVKRLYRHELRASRGPLRDLALPKLDEQGWDRVRAYLTKRELSDEVAISNGWYPTLLPTGAHLVIPATTLSGRGYWQSRALEGQEPRYRSAPGGRGDAAIVVFPFHADRGVLRPEVSVLVEGPLDALAAAALGCTGVALLGMRPPHSVWRVVEPFLSGRVVVVLPDLDALDAGVRWATAVRASGGRPLLVTTAPQKDLAALDPPSRARVLEKACERGSRR
jgi:hypothetical protein